MPSSFSTRDTWTPTFLLSNNRREIEQRLAPREIRTGRIAPYNEDGKERVPVATFTTQENRRPQIKSSGINLQRCSPGVQPTELLSQITSKSNKTTQQQHVTERHIMTFDCLSAKVYWKMNSTTRTIDLSIDTSAAADSYDRFSRLLFYHQWSRQHSRLTVVS